MKLTKQIIIDKVCNYYGITEEEIYSKDRKPEISIPKKIIWMYCRDNIKPALSLNKIGEGFYGSTHGNIHTGISRIRDWIKTDVNLINDIKVLDEIILNKSNLKKKQVIKDINTFFGNDLHNSFIEMLDDTELLNIEDYD